MYLPWLSTVDRKVLYTLLAKKRAEVELLRSDAEHGSLTNDSEIDIEFPKYDMGLPRPVRPSSTTVPQAQRRPGSLSGNGQPLNITIDRSGNRSGYTCGTSRNDLTSPISPSFGPRRFDIFSGTVSRRRSLPHDARLVAKGSTTSTRDGDTDDKDILMRDWQNRLQWEAAWVEIERNLDAYVERFVRVKGGREDVRRENEDIWNELVALRVEGEQLEERIRGAREDVRG